MERFPIEPFSDIWWVGLLSSLSFILLVIIFFKNKSDVVKRNFARFLSFSFLISYLITNLIAWNNDWWYIDYNLPLHLCHISFFISMIVLISRKQWMYEWSLFIAIPSAIHAILTPEMTAADHIWMYFDFYFLHAGLILTPIYLTILMGMKARKYSWWKTILRLQIAVALIFPINYFLESNYFFLSYKPDVDNPFLIGEWPIYIIFLELVMLAHVLIIYKLSPKYK